MSLAQVPLISPQTFIKAFVVHGIILASFLFIAYKVLKRNRNWLHVTLSGFFISSSTGFAFNMIFVLLSADPYSKIVVTLYYFTMFFLLTGSFFLTLFVITLLKTEMVLSKQKQLLILFTYSVLLFTMVFIPNGVKIDSSTNWNPAYSIYYGYFLLAMFTAFSVIPQLVFAYKIYKSFESEYLIKRWKFFVIGIIFFYIISYGTVIYNILDIQAIRTIFSFISLGLTIMGAILIYYGVGKLEE